jgi:5-methylcytosine-specific restriction endonuclease McrA
MSHILQLDVAGNACDWISSREAISMMATDRVLAGLGENEFVFRGGRNRATGLRTVMTVSSILLTRERVAPQRLSSDYEPPLTNRTLFARDQYLCLYCGNSFVRGALTRDHIVPASRGGSDSWSNSATACRKCNHAKGNRTPEEWGQLLLAIPFTPNWAEYLYLCNSRSIIADQMEYLKARFREGSPLL